MNTGPSPQSTLISLLHSIVMNPETHAKWINTLSFLENCGARLIASCEHPTLVKEEMLKHAAEEFRHAHYLKKQIRRVSSGGFESYELNNMLGGIASVQYLKRLNAMCSRYLSRLGLNGRSLKEAAYVLVTYAIELRAEELYPSYDRVLRSTGSKVTVKSIALEEEEHLREMRECIGRMPRGDQYAADLCAMEAALFRRWFDAIARDAEAIERQ